ncbi:MAG: pyruvate kinase [Alphaproteobacteria bacterium]
MMPRQSKTKIVCTIGPASSSRKVLQKMIEAGMNIARLNMAHGDFGHHAEVIAGIRATAEATGRRVAILADLPGPKLRIGRLEQPMELERGRRFVLSTNDTVGGVERASTTFSGLTRAVQPGDTIFLNDGLIQLQVDEIAGEDVACTVVVGGPLLSQKGMNIPNVDLGISAFTGRDRECLAFALEQGVDAVSQSFVERASDIEAVREAALSTGRDPLIVAKIERARALDHIDEILSASDGIMVARGDLGVEIPIHEIAITQKRLIREANLRAKPVITATQMLLSMVNNRRPTRAEATDVANAILDGTDCVMLSEESAMGAYPEDAVRTLSDIARSVEPHIGARRIAPPEPVVDNKDLVAASVAEIAGRAELSGILVPTKTGATARRVASFRLPNWITAVSRSEKTCQDLQFSYGVHAVHQPERPSSWRDFAESYFGGDEDGTRKILMTEGATAGAEGGTNRLEIIDI